MKQNRIKMSCSLTSAVCNCSPSKAFYKFLWIKWFLITNANSNDER
jgi:hypothetical protein